tara:strand:+ start:125 stop:2089 length:1965 start_codon:yes stop_codon:yes gene_type:complete
MNNNSVLSGLKKNTQNKIDTLIVFISGNGSNLQAIIDSIHNKIVQNIQISLVVCNNKNAYGLKRATEAGIPTYVDEFDKENETRATYDDRLLQVVNDYSPTMIVLAGWMHIFTKTFLNNPYRMINLHPALPGTFPGKNAIEDAFEAFQKGNICETGVMVHEVVEEIDAGKVIDSIKVPIYKTDTLDTLRTRIQYYEKSLLLQCITNVLLLNNGKDFYRGKVRDIYDIGYNMLALVHSNRLSSFDRHICDIQWKGHVLNKTSAWWFHNTRHIIPNHMLYSDENIMMVKKCKTFPIEVVVRAYMTGSTSTSLWTHYKSGVRDYCGNHLQDGYVKNQKLDTIILTPTTKGDVDIPITPEDIVKNNLATAEEWAYISQKALELFTFGQEVADKKGLILVDTKYEFGRDDSGNITLIDEIHTCDSSRYWIKESYETLFSKGKEPEKIDKDLVRDYVKSKCDPYNEPIPEISIDLKNKVSKAYIHFYETLTEHKVDHNEWKYTSFTKVSDYYFEHVNNAFAVILSGSVKDAPFVKRITKCLKDHGIYSADYVLSAHKNTSKVLELLHHYENRTETDNNGTSNPKIKKKIIYITVAGRSNALSGVVACNTNYPVIACPPFKDKMDMMVNVQSTLQMPSKVPVMTILEPGNVAIAVKRIFNL